MDQSPRQRYRVRRNSIRARRRVALLGGIALIAIAAGGLFVFGRGGTPTTPDETLPTAAAQLAPTSAFQSSTSAPPIQQGGPTARTALAEPGEPQSTTEAAALIPATFFDDQRITYEPGFYSPQIQAFLETQPGTLKGLWFVVGGRRHSFAEVLVGQTSYFSVNPKVILALIEVQSGAISSASPSSDQIGWALGYHGENGNRRGLTAQVRWAIKQLLYARRDYAQGAPLTYADGSSSPAPAGLSMSEYAIAYTLAPTTSPGVLPGRLNAFLDTYTRLFGDPRTPPEDWPAPAEPFLSWPLEQPVPVTSFFDHGGPFLSRNFGDGVVTYWGRREVDLAFAYNGHDGWDYAAAPPDMALAAADGDVVFAGNADDGCATRAVILDHGNGYRTLYWHLARVNVEIGQRVPRGQPIGMIGESGCVTGPHLHFGVQYLGRNTDPYGWCAGTPDPWQQNPAGTVSVWLWADRASPCAPPPSNSIVVDTESPGFAKSGDGWQSVPVGYGGGALFVPSTIGTSGLQPWDLRPLAEPAVAVWQPELPKAGRYRVLAYVPYALSGLEDATEVRYHVRYSGGETEVMVDDRLAANDWADLGTFMFDPSDAPSVSISSLVEANQRSIWADAIMWVPAE